MTPEEILASAINPAMAAVNNYGQGQMDLAKLQLKDRLDNASALSLPDARAQSVSGNWPASTTDAQAQRQRDLAEATLQREQDHHRLDGRAE